MRQFQGHRTLLFLLIFSCICARPLLAQFSTTLQTNIISGVTNIWPGDYLIGSFTVRNGLLIQNGGVLSNANGFLGEGLGMGSNNVTVIGAGSVWSNSAAYIGYHSYGNSMVISNAGRVMSSGGTTVGQYFGSSNNNVLVTGTNSKWDCGDYLLFGLGGPGNSIVISNGGRLTNKYTVAGSDATSTNNSILITGAGSTWSNSPSYFMLGAIGGSNKMVIEKGGKLYSNGGVLGEAAESSNNLALVSDSGSIWDDSATSSSMSIGLSGSGNRLIVTNGGQVLAYFVYVGRFNSSNNSVTVTGAGSSYFANCFFYVGYEGHDNLFTVTNGGLVSDKTLYISHSEGSSNNTVVISGTNALWQNEAIVLVGTSGSTATLTLTNGGRVTGVDTVIGFSNSSANNRVMVIGAGSKLSHSGNLFVGYEGSSNSLLISNGGGVSADYAILANLGGSTNNQAIVTGAGSYLSNKSDLYVGFADMGNRLIVSNGAWVTNAAGYVGLNPESSNNVMVVDGAGSSWTNSSTVCVGYSGCSNLLIIGNGGRVTNYSGFLGYETNSSNNAMMINGAGSIWTNGNTIFVGNAGQSNTMVIGNGALVSSKYGAIGEDDSSSNNTVYVEMGGTWRCQQLAVGDRGSHNAMYVQGGTVSATNLQVGYDPVYYNNMLWIDSGQVIVTNQAGTGVLEVYGGSLVMLDGYLRVNKLVITNEGAQAMIIGGTLAYNSLQLTPAFDVDADGIPNGWEQSHGLDPLDPFDADEDADGDGMSNLQEYLAGTSHTNAASRLMITSVTRTNNNMKVSWQAMGGKSYVVQANSGPGMTFGDVSPIVPVPGSGQANASYIDPGAATNANPRFYRVRLVQ